MAIFNLLFSVDKFGGHLIFSISLNNVTQNMLTHKGDYIEHNTTRNLLTSTDNVCMLLKIENLFI